MQNLVMLEKIKHVFCVELHFLVLVIVRHGAVDLIPEWMESFEDMHRLPSWEKSLLVIAVVRATFVQFSHCSYTYENNGRMYYLVEIS